MGIVSRIRSILLSILQGANLCVDYIDASTRKIASGSIIKVVEVDDPMIPRVASVKEGYVKIDLDIARGVVIC